MKRPIQLLCLLPFLIALLMAPATDLQSKPSPDPAGAPAGEAVTLADQFGGGSGRSSEFSAKAKLAQEQGDLQGAVLYLERAVRLDRDNAELSKALTEAKKQLAGRTQALKSLPADPKQREVELTKRYELGAAAEKSGNREKALATYKEIWLADSSYRDVDQKIKLLSAPAPVAMAAVAPLADKTERPAVSVAPLKALPPKNTTPVEIASASRQHEALSPLADKIIGNVPEAKPAAASVKETPLFSAKPVAEKQIASAKPALVSKDATVDKLPPLETGSSSASGLFQVAQPKIASKITAREAEKKIASTAIVEAKAPQAKPVVASATLQSPTVSAPSINVNEPKVQARTKTLVDEAYSIYKKGDLRTAREKMNEVLLIDAQNAQANTFMSETAAEWDARMADEKAVAEAASRETAGNEKLSTPITMETRRPASLGDFLNTLSFASGISFSIADGVDAQVTAKFTDTPLKDVLDYVLLPNGLKWQRVNGDVIVVTSDLRSRTFNLTPDTLASVQALMGSNQLQKMIWPPDGTPTLKGQEITLDDRANMLIATDSQKNLDRMEGLLKGLHEEGPVGLTTAIYKIDPEKGPKVKALLEAILNTGTSTPEDLNRKIIVDGGDLIVYASQRDLRKIEQTLKDENINPIFANKDLKIETFSLVPREPLMSNPDLAADFFRNVQEQLRIFLYAKSGQIEAAKAGRKMWADPDTMQITITDFPDNLAAVGDFVNSLEQVEQKQLFKVIYLKYALAGDMESQLRELFGLQSVTEMGPTGPIYLVTKNLRVDQDYKWRDLTLRIRAVNENDASDQRDDSVDILVRTGTRSETVTLQEFDSQFIDDYEIVAQDITPSGVPGEGRATLQIRYIPPPGQAGVPIAPTTPELQQPTATENTGLDIQSFENLNALIVRYRNPSDLKQVEDLLVMFDKPTPQVEIATKMVEVNETRAKEMTADWTISDLQDLDFDLSDSIINTRFAQDADQFVSQFEPALDTPNSANLMKSASVLELISGGTSTLNLRLRALEAEGIINVVNGPRLTIKNEEQGTLTINEINTNYNKPDSTLFLQKTSNSGGTGNGGTGQGDTAQTGGDQTGNGNSNGGNNNSTTTSNGRGQRIDMSLTPTVTGELVQVEVDVVFTDPVSNLGQLLFYELGPNAINSQYAFTNSGTQLRWGQVLSEKDIYTVASVKSGGTIVLGGWLSERQAIYDGGTPVLRNIPYIGRLLFNRNRDTLDRTNMLIFLNVQLQPFD